MRHKLAIRRLSQMSIFHDSRFLYSISKVLFFHRVLYSWTAKEKNLQLRSVQLQNCKSKNTKTRDDDCNIPIKSLNWLNTHQYG